MGAARHARCAAKCCTDHDNKSHAGPAGTVGSLTSHGLPAKQAAHDAASGCCYTLDTAAAAAGWLDIALQQVQQCDCVRQPVSQAGIVILLALNLTANDLRTHKHPGGNSQLQMPCGQHTRN